MASSSPHNNAILARLREILKASDLEVTTGKSIRKQLEAELGTDLSAHKKAIKQEIARYLQGEAIRQSQESSGTFLATTATTATATTASDTPPKPTKPPATTATRGGYGSLLSPELSAFLGGATEMPRTQVVKKLWEYIKSRDLQDPSDKRKIVLDDALSKIFKPPLTMFTMNKQLSRHCKTDDRRKEKAKPKKPSKAKTGVSAKSKKATKDKKTKTTKKSKKKPSSSSSAAKGEPGKKRGGGFGSVAILEPLRSFMGTAEAQRTEIVKKIWDYIKKHNCKDPNDGRNIIPDATLGRFLTPPVTMFTMQKQLSAYLEKKAPRAIKNGAA